MARWYMAPPQWHDMTINDTRADMGVNEPGAVAIKLLVRLDVPATTVRVNHGIGSDWSFGANHPTQPLWEAAEKWESATAIFAYNVTKRGAGGAQLPVRANFAVTATSSSRITQSQLAVLLS